MYKEVTTEKETTKVKLQHIDCRKIKKSERIKQEVEISVATEQSETVYFSLESSNRNYTRRKMKEENI